MYLPLIVVRGDVCFVVLNGSSNNLNISSCCINLFNAYSLVAPTGASLLAPKPFSTYCP